MILAYFTKFIIDTKITKGGLKETTLLHFYVHPALAFSFSHIIGNGRQVHFEQQKVAQNEHKIQAVYQNVFCQQE